ncbi:MAG: nucleoside-diphosphate kinase [Candidatus Scalindua sp. AMX11]|nr:MAG: nucleoside-diphosphate kinase [Candidatus Scalindua sp.]NOG83702.1 nucleoside-diphosphate kinase [Planctomycetota bacterium]RZV73848.1 MAG: nucleoside-diphosphate kinase [Candidatus Scalindua sp. SCAELEC01]TDE64856.1 MAG: nucleoside-diphosphate kinase [Candidatus Scalindua sp. AMX11]GJQ60653.1 MAG: nucleoside diphosphate kinase [Candidatus Scalindua sp.]
MQKTLVIIKPDSVKRRFIGKIITRFEDKGFEILGLKLLVISENVARENYSEHKGKEFFGKLIEFMTSGPVVVLVIEGTNAIEVTRTMMGETDCHKAAPGTIRGDFGLSNRYNLIHGSDSPESAEREISLFFSTEELLKT